MDKKEMDTNQNSDGDNKELSFDELNQIAGGRALRDRQAEQTIDLDDNTKSKI